ncbi:MAG: hypothetical protein IKG00_05600 [Lachnospiraceae bacterium]|nr:hypothetical protein [Lachnospiraceae bacterium]
MVRVKKAIISLLVFAVLLSAIVAFPLGGVKKAYATAAAGKCLGVDVSDHNGWIDWAKAKAGGVEFAIIRIGWGDDLTNQDDGKAQYNMQQCEKYGIPYGVYIYSYAISTAEVDSEIAHTVRMIQGHNPTLGIWFDMEDADSYKARHNFNPYTHGSQLTDFCLRYLRGMKAKGYARVGVYANPDYFYNVLNYNKIKAEGMIWLAHWGVSSPGFDCAMWQYSSDGTIAGGSGRFDMNWVFSGSPLFKLITGASAATTPIKDYERTNGSELEIRGDVDGDGKIDVKDLANIQKAILKKINIKGIAFTCADVNGDGTISVIDLAKVQKHILGKIDLIEEQKPVEPEDPVTPDEPAVPTSDDQSSGQSDNNAADLNTEASAGEDTEVTLQP